MDKIYSLWFHKLSIPEHTKNSMYEFFKEYKYIYEASESCYRSLGLTKNQIENIMNSKNKLDTIKCMINTLHERGIDLVDQGDKDYPYYLRQIPDSPTVLFTIGDTQYLNKPMVGIVGSRKCSEYGFECAKRLARDLASCGICVVSGMALGIDEAAHKGAIETGSTVAVLGTGIDICYPPSNYTLYKNIPNKGCIVSEYFPGTPGLPHQFPKRNRIISGMSLGIIVVEAALKSGSLITANLALEQNREVFAVPGNITSGLSIGTNNLIKNGAKLVMEAQDVLDEVDGYGFDFNKNSVQLKLKEYDKLLAKDEIIVYDCLSWQPIGVDEIATKLSWQIGALNTLLIKLQIKGLVQRLPGNRYMRVK
ncbi:MAG: DNA-processing protein DprA [Cellulosilyticaceae bacterium]